MAAENLTTHIDLLAINKTFGSTTMNTNTNTLSVGATTAPDVCSAFAAQHPWTQYYINGIHSLGGKNTRFLAVAPIAATHEKVLSGYASHEVVRGFVFAETHVAGFPQVAFIRGDCAAVIFEIREEGSDLTYTLGVRQIRTAVGRSNLLETIAGMIDLVRGTFVLPANAVFANIQHEVLEETGGALTMDTSTFINLSAWQHERRAHMASLRHGDMLTDASPLSPGGSDEKVHLFACCVTLPPGSLRAINGARGGSEKEAEHTLVQVLPMSEAIFVFADVKFLAAYALLQAYKAHTHTFERT